MDDFRKNSIYRWMRTGGYVHGVETSIVWTIDWMGLEQRAVSLLKDFSNLDQFRFVAIMLLEGLTVRRSTSAICSDLRGFPQYISPVQETSRRWNHVGLN